MDFIIVTPDDRKHGLWGAATHAIGKDRNKTLCGKNPNNWQWQWDLTVKHVTCKKCLMILKRLS